MAIDLSGAQFGWKKPVSPWNVWEAHRVYGAVNTHHPGYISDYETKRDAKWKEADSWVWRIKQIGRSQAYRMLGAIIELSRINNRDREALLQSFFGSATTKMPARSW